ncbi:SPOR domain-containing protein [Polaribacter sp. MSW13]|uniref:SPOR domain-containing protein n=1 Tax=Polaribacter marinus TaxID=2916838 RepID=A0A9X1VLJ7_9FLAO|nr:SPOR domain-containing protein [Polaribacter marinus]MCI2228714.1 SPOR domain-containing protein [Polaribacter marinus]
MKKTILITLFLTGFFAGTVKISAQNNTNSSKKVKELIEKKRAYNKKFGFGYRIQLYNGPEQKARSLHSKFKVLFPDVYSKLKFDSPDWKVQVGNYKTRLEADKAIVNFSEKFSGIIVIPMGK